MNLIGYIRTPSGLKAMVIQEVGNESYLEYRKLEFAEVPIQDAENGPHKSLTLLTDSWEILAGKCHLNEQTLFHIIVVLLETVPVFVSHKTSALPFTRTPKYYQATAAHPRAYKGTTHKPPKPRKTLLVNIHKHLCHQQTLKKILKTLTPYWPSALVLLEKAGYRTTALKSTDIETGDLYFAYHHSGYGKEAAEKYPEPFVEYILPNIKGLAWPIVAEFLSIYWSLSLNRKKVAFACGCQIDLSGR